VKILHFFKTSLPDTIGGVEQVIDQISRGAVSYGVSSEVLSLTSQRVASTFEINGYISHRSPLSFNLASTGFSVSAVFRFVQLAKNADLIHYHYPWPFMDLVHFFAKVKKPTVVTYHSDIVRQANLKKLYQPLQKAFLRDVSAIVATSPNYLSTSEVLPIYASKVSVIPIGLDKSTYPIVSAKDLSKWRERFGHRFFLFVGVIRYYKGLHILLEAAVGSNFPIVIVGSGPIEQELKTQAAKLGLRNIHFLGQLLDEDKVALLRLCYAVVFPSHLRSEAFGISLLEGAMFGKPMISSEIGTGTTYINVSGETGLVVPPSNPKALRQAMDNLWDNPLFAAEMGRLAEKRYWALFTADKMVNSYVELYRKLLQEPNSQQMINDY